MAEPVSHRPIFQSASIAGGSQLVLFFPQDHNTSCRLPPLDGRCEPYQWLFFGALVWCPTWRREQGGEGSWTPSKVLRRLRCDFLAQIGMRYARQIQQHLRQGHGLALHQPVVPLGHGVDAMAEQIMRLRDVTDRGYALRSA